jgi:putative membrane protein
MGKTKMKEESSIQNTTVDFLLPVGKGAVAGTVATIPMTAFMLLMQQALPRWQHYDLPPEKLTDELADRAGAKKHMNKPQKVALALVAHFAYGAAMGTLYSLLMQRGNIKTYPFLLKGNIFGLAVWGASYLGLLPAMQMSTTAPKETPHRNLLMIGAHIVWGTVLAVTVHILGD